MRAQPDTAAGAVFLLVVIGFVGVAGGLFVRIAGLDPAAPGLPHNLLHASVALVLVAATVYLGFRDSGLFVPALLLAILAAWSPIALLQRRLLGLTFPGVDYLIPIALYTVVVAATSLKRGVGWHRLGTLDGRTLVILVVFCVVTAVGLVIWGRTSPEGIAEYRAQLPTGSLVVLIAAGGAFALTNAVVEEAIFRGAIRDGLTRFLPGWVEVLVTAAAFASLHVQGFPRGGLGVVMVFVWGIGLGALRTRSGGMLGPVIGHLGADLTIFAILARPV